MQRAAPAADGAALPAAVVVVALVCVTLLTASALSYLVARLGALLRFRDHVRIPRAELDEHFTRRDTSITVLVPSYAEEPRVVRTTLWSAALQEFPHTRVVLVLSGSHPTADDVADLDRNYDVAVDWLERMATAEPRDDHTGVFFVRQLLLRLAGELRSASRALRATVPAGQLPPHRRKLHLQTQLVRIFQSDLGIFERKCYAALSHETNRAMNLNAYLSLMGGSWVEDHTPAGVILRAAEPGATPDRVVPDPDYLLTLDADSMLLRAYCLRLVHHLEQPGNERVAIAQTPYSSYPGAPTAIERIAGATTDVQHLQHARAAIPPRVSPCGSSGASCWPATRPLSSPTAETRHRRPRHHGGRGPPHGVDFGPRGEGRSHAVSGADPWRAALSSRRDRPRALKWRECASVSLSVHLDRRHSSICSWRARADSLQECLC